MATFIYCPKSGDRVFAESPDNGIAIIQWCNGCRHAIGGCHLAYPAAIPKSYWRMEAVTMASAIVSLCGGAAWDERGTIRLLVPGVWAKKAHNMMLATMNAAGVLPTPSDRNLAALVLAGYGLEEDFTVGHYGGPSEKPKYLGWYRDESSSRVVLLLDAGETIRVSSPWIPDTVLGNGGPLPKIDAPEA